MEAKEELLELILDVSFERRKVTLASGRESDFYLDLRQTLMRPRGVVLAGELALEQLLAGPAVDAVGGMAIGADPITASIITLAAIEGRELRGFIVRKETKEHGKGRAVEGPVAPGEKVVIVEDVVTTGGSSLRAIERVEQFGLSVVGVLAIIDRLEGGAEAFAEKGYQLRTLLTVRDFGIEV